MEQKINWGISKELQADIRYEPNACKSYVMDISLGCPHRCIYCLFSPLELMVYKLQNPEYKGNVLPLKLDKFLSRKEFPPFIYLCYACDPLGNQQLVQRTITVLKKLFSHNVAVLFITKGILTDDLLDVIRMRPDLMEMQIGITNFDDRRNKVVEPAAPSYENRLENFKKLADIKGLGSATVRIDPLLPSIDDTRENIERITDDVSSLGVKEAIIGYVILTKDLRERLKQDEFTRQAAQALSEKTPTISEREIYSFPFEEKVQNLRLFEKICQKKGMKMSVCGCKDHKLKETSFTWICHPFNRTRREELEKQTGFSMEVSHLE